MYRIKRRWGDGKKDLKKCTKQKSRLPRVGLIDPLIGSPFGGRSCVVLDQFRIEEPEPAAILPDREAAPAKFAVRARFAGPCAAAG